MRIGEYATLAWLAATADALPGGVRADRGADVPPLRPRLPAAPPRRDPAAWLNRLAAGWDGRVIIAWLLLALGALPAAMYVWAGLLGAVSVAESVVSWRRFERSRATAGEFDEMEGEGE